MANWFVQKLVATGNVIGFVSDDSQDFAKIPQPPFQLVGPFPTQSAAQASVAGVPAVNAVIAAILAKNPATLTNADILNYLVQKFGGA